MSKENVGLKETIDFESSQNKPSTSTRLSLLFIPERDFIADIRGLLFSLYRHKEFCPPLVQRRLAKRLKQTKHSIYRINRIKSKAKATFELIIKPRKNNGNIYSV